MGEAVSGSTDKRVPPELLKQASNEMLARWVLKNLDWSGGNSDDNGRFLAAIIAEIQRQSAQSASGTKEADAIQALADIKWDIEHCDWACVDCGTDPVMTETDIACTLRHFSEKHGALPEPYRNGKVHPSHEGTNNAEAQANHVHSEKSGQLAASAPSSTGTKHGDFTIAHARPEDDLPQIENVCVGCGEVNKCITIRYEFEGDCDLECTECGSREFEEGERAALLRVIDQRDKLAETPRSATGTSQDEGAAPDRAAIMQAAYKIDPECWISYSGKEKKFKQAMDRRRTAAIAEATKATADGGAKHG